MDTQIIAIYCLCDDYIHAQGIKAWPNEKISIQEVMALALVAMKYFSGNLEVARQFFIEQKYIKEVCKSCINKRLHGFTREQWNRFLRYMILWKRAQNPCLSYIIDTFPVPACRNIRIRNSRIYQGEDYRGYNASKHEYFYGVKTSVITTREGVPYQVDLSPGKEHDCTIFQVIDIHLPRNSTLFCDSAYTDYKRQQELLEKQEIRTVSERKSNSLMPMSIRDYLELKQVRRTIENTFAEVSKLLPKCIHAVTAAGFEVKIMCFVVAVAINFALQ